MQPKKNNWKLAIALGSTIRELRSECDFSQEVFAERCGFYRTYLSRIETGRANPTLSALEVMASALNLSLLELMEQLEMRLSHSDDEETKPIDSTQTS